MTDRWIIYDLNLLDQDLELHFRTTMAHDQVIFTDTWLIDLPDFKVRRNAAHGGQLVIYVRKEVK